MQNPTFVPAWFLSGIFESLAPYSSWLWLVGALVILVVFFRPVLQLMGVVIIPEDRIGLVTKKFVLFGEHKELPSGRILALNGEAGFQSQTLAPGLYFWKWIWQYEVTPQPLTVIPDGLIGLIMPKDGGELLAGAVLARRVDCQMFQDAEMFLRAGGHKGRQAAFLTPGTYRINTFLFEITLANMTQIKENRVGIVTTLDGAPLGPGNYPLNTSTSCALSTSPPPSSSSTGPTPAARPISSTNTSAPSPSAARMASPSISTSHRSFTSR